MSKTPLLLALLSLLVLTPVLVAGPPKGPSGRLVLDPVPALQDEVKRLEKVVAKDPKSRLSNLYLDEARARLAAAWGNIGEARAAWQRVIAVREELVRPLEALNKDRDVTPPVLAVFRYDLADARCQLAEVEGDRTVLVRELPKVIAFSEWSLARLRSPARADNYSPEQFMQVEKDLLKEIRQARQRLDAVKRR